MERDIKIASLRIGGADAAYPVISNRGGMLDVNGIGCKLIRQGQDLVGVVGRVGRVIRTGRGQAAGGHTQLIQIDRAGRLYVKLVCGRLGEAAGAHQVAVDKVVELAAGDRDPHGHPLVFVAVVGEICCYILGGGPAVFFIYIMAKNTACLPYWRFIIS